tara:strand:+ start:915 stop:1283 length:369 start_codon:yes stop_codon:yes gene_type:complete
MFCTYNYSEFPLVKVTFDGGIKCEEDFILFTEQWINLYNDEKEFLFEFDMAGIGLINPYYSYKMASFISELKKRPVQYLTHSKIMNVNSFTKYLLLLVFKIQKPVAPVEIHYTDGTISHLLP